MAELDHIAVCPRCWAPAGPRELFCTGCGGPVKAGFPSLLLGAVRTLSAKGWVVTEFRKDSIPSNAAGGDSWSLVLYFFRLAPPVVSPKVSADVLGVMRAVFSGYGSPGVMVRDRTELDVFRAMASFADRAPRLSLPFWAEACGRCSGQGGDWMFSLCKCPVSEGGWRPFSGGLPDKCSYAAEQVVTRDERVRIMVDLFKGRPVAQRALRRMV